MPLNKPSGNMYKKHYTWNPIAGNRPEKWEGEEPKGGCEHKCKYCYVEQLKKKFPAIDKKYSGEYRIVEKELKENLYKYGEGITIFVQNMSDLFAKGVPKEMILRVLKYCNKYPRNTYLFQSKSPIFFIPYIHNFPQNTILCTTIETNRVITYIQNSISRAPNPYKRYEAMKAMLAIKRINKFKTSVTIEPIMDFDLHILVDWMNKIEPDFINIGADSKHTKPPLPEPSWEQVQDLMHELNKFTTVKVKKNLWRLKK